MNWWGKYNLEMVKLLLSEDVVISQCLCQSRDSFHFSYLHVSYTSTPHCISFGILSNRLLRSDLQMSMQLGEGSCIELKIGQK